MIEIDFLVVGAGLFGSVCAERLASAGKRVLVLERRDHIGGNCWSEIDETTGIEVHTYGSHIFHTSNQMVWDYLNLFTRFNGYRHTVWTVFKDKVYSMPINLGTINAYYGLNLKPHEVSAFLVGQNQDNELYENPSNLEEQAISLVGRPLYETFIKGYTIKQWGQDPKELPAGIITRLPVRHNYNNHYFKDTYEGIPLEGYGTLFARLLDHQNITVELGTDWFDVKEDYQGNVPVIFSARIDQFFNYQHGQLEWRTIEFERQTHNISDFQGCSVMNYAEVEVPYTRIHEFKHYHPERSFVQKTVTFKEYSKIISETSEPYYPVNSLRNAELLARYQQDAYKIENVWFGGRLGGYQYLDMDDTVELALKLIKEIL